MNIENLITEIRDTVVRHRLGNEGEYARWLWQNGSGGRNLGVNEYGCADAANILYTVGSFPSESESRTAHIRVLQSLQDPETGLFTEPTHHPFHTTAHCVAALELFDAKPAYPLRYMEQFDDETKLVRYLEALDWEGDPWNQSHRGAGLYAAAVLAGNVSETWEDAYFGWLWDNADPETGFWRRDAVAAGKKPPFHHLAGTFHYLFNHEYAHRPLRYPERVIDTCIALYEEKKTTADFCRGIGFSDIDWVYCVNRASRQTAYRFDDCRRALRGFAGDYIAYLNTVDPLTDDGFNDLHALFGSVCCLAELQQALPGELRTRKPLKLVLDRRPFI